MIKSFQIHRFIRQYATQRNPSFKEIERSDIDYFRSFLPSSSVMSKLTGSSAEELSAFNNDWMNKYHGKSTLVLRPKSSDEVSQILKYCNEKRIAVVPQGGNTGLVGGSVPVFDEVVISSQLMNKVREFDANSGAIICDSGCVLEHIESHLSEHGYTIPLDLGAKGSCHIGGNVATNAGGLRLLRYGSLHGSVLGLEVVLPNGDIISDLKTLRKDNTGYDLKQLFIGSEGTLGFITGVSILTPPKPKSVKVALLALKNFESVQKVFREAKFDLAEILSAFEFFDAHSMELVQKHLSGARSPIDTASNFYVLIETSGSNVNHDSEKLENFLMRMMESDVVLDGAVAQDNSQASSIWNLREGIPEACSKSGSVYKYDVSMPVPSLYQLVEDIRQRLASKGLYSLENQSDSSLVTSVIGYGHLGDGNLHLNISAKEYSTKLTEAIEPFIYEWLQKVNGSISAEHGLGVMKRNYLHYSKTENMIKTMKNLKNLFDPHGIMNPYKYLPEEG